jgi:hypothetical protein
MAAPLPDKITLPVDTGNTGKKVRTQTRVIGPDTVHEHFFIKGTTRDVTGRYRGSSGVLTVPIAVHNGTSTGFLWLINPVGSSKILALDRVSFSQQFIVLAVDLLGGELRMSRCTFTGVASAGLLTPAKRDSNDAANVGEIRTASTGLAVTLGAAIIGYQYQTMDLATGGAGHWNPHTWEYNPDEEEDDQVLLRAGEGIVWWHAIAVTTANRRLFINPAWDEFNA